MGCTDTSRTCGVESPSRADAVARPSRMVVDARPSRRDLVLGSGDPDNGD